MPVNKHKTVRTSMIVPSSAYHEVQQLAAANDVSVAWIMRHALMEFLRAHRGETKIPLQRARRAKKQVAAGGKGAGS